LAAPCQRRVKTGTAEANREPVLPPATPCRALDRRNRVMCKYSQCAYSICSQAVDSTPRKGGRAAECGGLLNLCLGSSAASKLPSDRSAPGNLGLDARVMMKVTRQRMRTASSRAELFGAGERNLLDASWPASHFYFFHRTIGWRGQDRTRL